MRPQFAPGAWRLALPLLLAALPALVLSPALALALAVGGYAVLAFYRDPERSPAGDGLVSPADGRIQAVRVEDDRVRVDVFMNVTDVHVNRAPLTGTVTGVEHHPGGHLPAFAKASARNERVVVTAEGPDGPWTLTLVAGAVARRITPYASPGTALDRGERVGHIAFGSRAAVLCPPSVGPDDVRVTTGERVRAGETVLAAPD
jgi:phosphatidylserine decarboxylase